MQRRTFLAGAATLAAAPALVRAQAWPAKQIRFIVPYIPGSAPDVIARTLAERLGSALGQTLVIENRPGAGSNIGNELIAKASPDGYAIGLATSAMTTNPWLYRKVAYDPVADFAPINLSIAMPHILVVAADAPVKTVPDLIRLFIFLRIFLRLASYIILWHSGKARDLANIVAPKRCDVCFISWYISNLWVHSSLKKKGGTPLRRKLKNKNGYK